MAQKVGYMDDDVCFTEGPFVLCNPYSNGWRIEAEMKGKSFPVLPDMTIYPVMRKLGLDGKTCDEKLAEMICDFLNQMVREGKIILSGSSWVLKPN